MEVFIMFYSIARVVVSLLSRLFFRIEINGIENIPKEGACIISANHKSVLDPPVLGALMPRKVYTMAKEELFDNPFLALIIRNLGVFPVKRGKGDIGAIKTALKVLKEGKVFAIFPEGTRSKNGKLGKAQPGVAMIALKAQVPIIPVANQGNYKLFSKMVINIGTPIVIDEYYNQKLKIEQFQEISDGVMSHIQDLLEAN